MGPTQGPYILQLCMGPSYFWGSDPSWPPYFAHWLTRPSNPALVWSSKSIVLSSLTWPSFLSSNQLIHSAQYILRAWCKHQWRHIWLRENGRREGWCIHRVMAVSLCPRCCGTEMLSYGGSSVKYLQPVCEIRGVRRGQTPQKYEGPMQSCNM